MTSTFSQPVVCPVLVGRDEALSSLRLLQHQAAEGGTVALVSGEAGIGKSRLVAEFLAEAGASGCRVMRDRFFEQDGNLPYSAIARLLAGPPADDAGTASLLAPFADDLRLMVPGAGRATDAGAGGEGDPEGDRRRILHALTGAVRALSGDRFTVIALEDLHLADASSLDAVLEVARERLPGCLIVLSFRSDERSPALTRMLAELDRERLSAEIGLAGLRLSDVDRMLRACLASDRATRADVLHAIHQLTGGNPFFVEELTRSILDQAGSIEGLEALRLADFNLPRGVNEAVRRRTVGLSPEARAVLSLAAVAGARFDFPLLCELSGRNDAELVALIKELIAAQLVVEEKEDQFAFRHALTREAIRSEMLSRERRTLSQKIADAMEEMHAGDIEGHLDDLAGLFYEAGNWEKALLYSTKAGERAMALYAPAEALAHLSRAIDAGQRLHRTDLAEVFRLRGAANEAIGDFEAARSDYERAASAAAADPRTRWRALLDLGLLWASRDYSRSEPYYREALELARQLDDPSAIAHSLNRLGNWYSNTGDLDSARELSEQALELFRQAGDRRGLAQTLDLLGIACLMGMLFKLCIGYYREALPLLEELDDRPTLVSAMASIQVASSTRQGDMVVPAVTLKEGSDFGERALALSLRMGWKAAQSYALWQTAFSLAPQGEFDRALSYAAEAAAIAGEIGHTQWQIGAECALGTAYLDILATEEAEEHLRRALDGALEMASDLWLKQAQALLIDTLVERRDLDAAAALYEPAAPEAPGTFGYRQLYASGADLALATGNLERATEMLGRLEAATGQPATGLVALRLARLRSRVLETSGELDGALACLRVAGAAARELGNLSYLWRLQTDLARVLVDAGRRDDARTAASEAIDLLDSLSNRVPAGHLRDQFLHRAIAFLPSPLRPRTARGQADVLTSREAEIAALVAHGFTSREIAERLVLSHRTVETHIANATAKLGFTTRSQLAAWAVEHGLLPAEP